MKRLFLLFAAVMLIAGAAYSKTPSADVIRDVKEGVAELQQACPMDYGVGMVMVSASYDPATYVVNYVFESDFTADYLKSISGALIGSITGNTYTRAVLEEGFSYKFVFRDKKGATVYVLPITPNNL